MKLIVLSVPILIHINQVANGLGIVLIQGQVPCVKVSQDFFDRHLLVFPPASSSQKDCPENINFSICYPLQLTDRHPLSNCPQLLQPTHLPQLVGKFLWPSTHMKHNQTIWHRFDLSDTLQIWWKVLTFTWIVQDPVETSTCLDFYQLVLFYTTAGAAMLGAVGVALLIFVKAVKRNGKERRHVKWMSVNDIGLK